MARSKIWIGALIALLLGAAPAFAGVAIDNSARLDPYDPVPPIQFSHWYAGYGCESECGHHCWQSCYHRASCDESCYRHRDCDRDCRPACEHDCRDACEHDCRQNCDDRGCTNDGDRRTEVNATPCISGHCSETEHWEHRWRDGDHYSEEYLDRGSHQGEHDHYRHRFNDDDDSDDGPQH